MSAAWDDTAPAAVERVRLRRISRTFGFVDVRLSSVNLHDLRIEEGQDGQLTIKPPEHFDKQGRRWPAYSLQPECRALVEAEIRALWNRS